MKKVIVVMSLLAASTVTGAYQTEENEVPTPVPTVSEVPVVETITPALQAPQPEKPLVNHVALAQAEKVEAKQKRLLKIAYNMAKQEGFKNPEIVQSILLQETHAGGMKSYKVANPGPEAYFGPMQLKLNAARDVLARFPHLYEKYDFHTTTDDEVKANLILNEHFNIEVATKYIRLLQTLYGYTGRELVNAFNRGPTGVKKIDSRKFHYAVGAEQKLAAMKRQASN